MRKRSVGETKQADNLDINHWNEARRLYPIVLIVDGIKLGFQFTANQLRVARERWAKNPKTQVKHSGIKEIRDLFRVAIILLGAAVLSGCAGGFGLVRVMEPPLKKLDIAEVAANLPEGQALLVNYDMQSLQTASSLTAGNDSTLTPNAMMELIKFGGGLGGDAKYRALQDAINKDRNVNVTVAIAESAHIRDMRLSDNQTKLVQQSRLIDVVNRVVITQAVPVVITPPPAIPPIVVDPPSANPPVDLPDVPGNDSEAFFRGLKWLRQDTVGPSARVTKTLRAVNVVSTSRMTLDADNIGSWPATGPISDGHGVICIAVNRGGTWEGGKFDHVRANTRDRNFNNLCGYLAVCPRPGEPVRFWLLSYDGRQATNYLETRWPG